MSRIIAITCYQCKDKEGAIATFGRSAEGEQVTPSFPDYFRYLQWLKDKGASELPYSLTEPGGRYYIPDQSSQEEEKV